MSELQAQSLYECIMEEAPREHVTLVPIGGNQHICRMGTREKPFFIWSLEDWTREKWRFVVARQKVEIVV